MRRFGLLVLAALTILAGGCASFQGPASVAPTAVLDAYPLQGTAPLSVSFDAGRSVDDVAIVDYAWDFGDDSAQTVQAASETQGPQVSYAYADPGTYTARVTVTDNSGLVSTTTVEILVINTAPIAGCRLSNDAPVRHEQVLFDGSGSIDPDGHLVDFIWDFGDGDTMRGTRVGHAYEELGVYTVTLIVQDNSGATAAATHEIIVHLGSSGGGGCGGSSAISLSLRAD